MEQRHSSRYDAGVKAVKCNAGSAFRRTTVLHFAEFWSRIIMRHAETGRVKIITEPTIIVTCPAIDTYDRLAMSMHFNQH